MGMNSFIYIFSLGSVIIAQVTGNWLIKIPINRLGITNQIKNFFSILHGKLAFFFKI